MKTGKNRATLPSPAGSIALAQEYCLASPSEYIGNDKGTGFPLLQLEPPQCTFFVPVAKFI